MKIDQGTIKCSGNLVKFTIQTPHSQSNLINFNEYPEYLSAGGGFGPVSEVGYGVSYIVCHEDLIMFYSEEA